MRLLIITKDFPDMPGGVSDYCKALATNLKDQSDIDIHIITSDSNEVKDVDPINIHRFVKSWGFKSISPIFMKILEIKPDIVNLQYVCYSYDRYGMPIWLPFLLLYLKLKEVPIVTTFHEVAIDFSKNPKHFIAAIIQRIINFFICIFSAHIIVTIPHWKKMLCFFNKKITIIPSGNNFSISKLSESEKQNLRSKIAPSNEIIISTIGFNTKYKKDDLILRSISELNTEQKKQKFKFLVIGGLINYKLNNVDNLAENIFLTGYLRNEEVYRYLQISDIFMILNTDRRGGISLKSGSIAAAYASSLPIISTNGLLTSKEYFNHKKNVYFCKSYKKEDVKNAILELANDDLLRASISKESSIFYNDVLSWDILSKKYLEVFSLVKHNKR